MLRQGICGRVDDGHDKPERGPWFVNFGETIEKGDLNSSTVGRDAQRWLQTA